MSFRLVVAFGQVLVLELYVVGGTIREERPLFFGQRPRLLDRAANVQVTADQPFARWHQAACADDDFILDHRAVHDGAAHANQNPVAQRTAVEHDLVADGHFVTDQQGEAVRVERAGVRNVQDAAILNAGAGADADAVHVAAYHRQRPYRAVFAELNVA